MTNKQAIVLAFLRARAMESAVPPSFDEIAAHFGRSKSRVYAVVDALERRGLIRRVKGHARSIEVIGIGEYERGFRDGVASANLAAA